MIHPRVFYALPLSKLKPHCATHNQTKGKARKAQCTRLLITVSWDLRLRLTYRFPNFVKLECLANSDDSIYKATSFFLRILLDNGGLRQAYNKQQVYLHISETLQGGLSQLN